MSTSSPNLNQGPPLPPNLQPPPQANVSQLAGQQADPSGSAALQKAVIEKLMFVEQSLNDIGKMMPAAAPVAQGFIDNIRKGMASILAQGAAPPPALGAGGGLMAGPQTMSNPTA